MQYFISIIEIIFLQTSKQLFPALRSYRVIYIIAVPNDFVSAPPLINKLMTTPWRMPSV